MTAVKLVSISNQGRGDVFFSSCPHVYLKFRPLKGISFSRVFSLEKHEREY